MAFSAPITEKTVHWPITKPTGIRQRISITHRPETEVGREYLKQNGGPGSGLGRDGCVAEPPNHATVIHIAKSTRLRAYNEYSKN